jgi:hypothetical protein
LQFLKAVFRKTFRVGREVGLGWGCLDQFLCKLHGELSWNAHYQNYCQKLEEKPQSPEYQGSVILFFSQIFFGGCLHQIIRKVFEECVISSVNSTKFPYF